MHDSKTLRLAAIALTEENLGQFMTYQRLVREALQVADRAAWAGAFAFAHAKGLEATGLDTLVHQRIRATVADFCARRVALLTLRGRVAQLEQGARTSKEVEQLTRAKAQLPKLMEIADFDARYGTESVALMLKHEAVLLELHISLAKLEGGGHLHAVNA